MILESIKLRFSIVSFLILVDSFFVTGKDLRLLGFFSVTGKSWNGGLACYTAMQMALEDINKRDDILKDYNITFNWFDSKCDSGTSVFGMTTRFQTDPPYVMLLGAPCSVASEATAQASYLWNVTQLSLASASPILSDRSRFPRFFRLALPDQLLNPARIELMRLFNWTKVATINQAREFFSAVTDDFVQRVQGTNITILTQEIFVSSSTARIENLKNHDARIIVTAMYEDKARVVLCEAYKTGMYGSKIVWIFPGWYTTTFWKIDLDTVGCTAEQMSDVVEGSFVTGAMYWNPVEERGIAGLTSKEFLALYLKYPTYRPEMKDNEQLAYHSYDHIWIAALALNCTIQRLKDMGHPKTLDMFTYADSDIGKIIFECMGNTSILGVSGTIKFKDGADPNRMVNIERIQDGKRTTVAFYRQDLTPPHFEWVKGALKWKDGFIPRDSSYITEEEIHIPNKLYAALISIASLGIGQTLCFFSFNIIYRNNRTIKLSSPNINNVLLIGCIMCYCTVFFKTAGIETAAICKARVCCLSLGFTITFGSLFSKTWRVYRIFTNKNLLRRKIKDVQLLAVITGLVALVSLVLVVWEAIAPFSVVKRQLYKEVFYRSNDEEVHPFIRVCESEHSEYFSWALYIIQGALLTFGAFLAWETREVRIPALNDSRQIGLCLYNVVVLSALGLTLSLILVGQDVLLYGITSGCLLVGTTLTQTLIFIPKIRAVYYKVENNDTDTAANTGTWVNSVSKNMAGPRARSRPAASSDAMHKTSLPSTSVPP